MALQGLTAPAVQTQSRTAGRAETPGRLPAPDGADEPRIAAREHCGAVLKLEDVDAAFARIVALGRPIREIERLPVKVALGRITADDVRTAIPLPPFDHSAVDGYGVGRDDSVGERRSLRLVERVAAGAVGARHLEPGQAVRLLTGAPVPSGVAAVVFEERCRLSGRTVTLAAGREGDSPNIRRRGEDVESGEVIVDAGTSLDARHVALLAAAGVTSVQVVRRVRVAVFSNGDELREPGEILGPGAIHDSNRPMLRALLARPWIELVDAGLHRDDPALLAKAMREAADNADAVVCSGGASGSDADHVLAAILTCGGEARSVKLALKPGKPLVAGCLRERPVLGLPGNPVAAMVHFLLFGRPLLQRLAGAAAERPAGQAAVAAEAIPHAAGRREFLPARVVGHEDDGRARLAKLGRGGSARLRPLALADGLADIAAGRGSLAAGEALRFHPFTPAFAI